MSVFLNKLEDWWLEIFDKLVDYVLVEGFFVFSLRLLVEVVEISDWMLFYYFKDKVELMEVILICVVECMVILLGGYIV